LCPRPDLWCHISWLKSMRCTSTFALSFVFSSSSSSLSLSRLFVFLVRSVTLFLPCVPSIFHLSRVVTSVSLTCTRGSTASGLTMYGDALTAAYNMMRGTRAASTVTCLSPSVCLCLSLSLLVSLSLCLLLSLFLSFISVSVLSVLPIYSYSLHLVCALLSLVLSVVISCVVFDSVFFQTKRQAATR